jgi:hypothetical protein
MRTLARRASRLLMLVVTIGILTTTAARATVVFSTDFESGLPAQISAPGSVIEPVQGYAGLGGNPFAGNLLRYDALAIMDTKLKLAGLPQHDAVTIGFLLAIIDSWDGTELLQIYLDGTLVFSHWFQIATGDASSYVAPAGGLLSSGSNLGWTNSSYHGRDRAYDLSVDSLFVNIPHTADTLEVTWRLGAVSGGAAANWQGGTDESWGIDNLTVSVSGTPTGVPGGAMSARSALLHPAVPNPFNPSTRIVYEVPTGSEDVSLSIYDVGGRLVRTLVRNQRVSGERSVVWDGHDDGGRRVASGVYFYRLTTPASSQTRKMVLLK